MRVICIDASPPIGMPKAPLVEGETYTIQREQETDVDMAYILVETRNWQEINRIAFGKERFVPTSEINETEFNRNYQKEKA